jgi:hypothetical protein
MKKSKNDYTEVSTDQINDLTHVLKEMIAAEKSKPQPNQQWLKAFETLIPLVKSYLFIVNLLASKKTKLKTLKRLIFGSTSEKKGRGEPEGNGGAPSAGGGSTPPSPPSKDLSTEDQSKNPEDKSDVPSPEDKSKDPGDDPGKKKRIGGGGKNGHDAYTGASEIHCPLCEGTRPGDICPECNNSKLYSKPAVTSVRLIGSAPVEALKFIQERAGCVCGAEFLAPAPVAYKDLLHGPKYSASALSAMIHQKYDLGVPYGALAKLQQNVGIPLPATTQSNQIRDNIGPLISVFEVLERMGINMDLVGYDDTPIKILEGRLKKDGSKSIIGYGSVFVCSNIDGQEKIVLYRLDWEHAGKYLMRLLALRDTDRSQLIGACDGALAYEKGQQKTMAVNCNSHSRRKFVLHDPDEVDFFCNFIIGRYKSVYKFEKECHALGMTALERRDYHAKHSTSPMEDIRKMCEFITSMPDSLNLSKLREELQIPEYLIPSGPNSDLYKYAQYILKRWNALSAFTVVPGAPVDTNWVEIKIKAIIEIRKKGLFFKTLQSALVSGKILSVIETAQENGVNSVEYVEFLLTYSEEVLKAPENFLPWNYQAHFLYADYKRSQHDKIKQSWPSPPEMMPGRGYHSSVRPEAQSESS